MLAYSLRKGLIENFVQILHLLKGYEEKGRENLSSKKLALGMGFW
jgi:hypothetical protein